MPTLADKSSELVEAEVARVAAEKLAAEEAEAARFHPAFIVSAPDDDHGDNGEKEERAARLKAEAEEMKAEMEEQASSLMQEVAAAQWKTEQESMLAFGQRTAEEEAASTELMVDEKLAAWRLVCSALINMHGHGCQYRRPIKRVAGGESGCLSGNCSRTIVNLWLRGSLVHSDCYQLDMLDLKSPWCEEITSLVSKITDQSTASIHDNLYASLL